MNTKLLHTILIFLFFSCRPKVGMLAKIKKNCFSYFYRQGRAMVSPIWLYIKNVVDRDQRILCKKHFKSVISLNVKHRLLTLRRVSETDSETIAIFIAGDLHYLLLECFRFIFLAIARRKIPELYI